MKIKIKLIIIKKKKKKNMIKFIKKYLNKNIFF